MPGLGRSRERGAVAVEAAFALPLLVLFFAGIVDFGFILNDLQQVNNATFRAARELTVDEYDGAAGCVADPATATDTQNVVCLLRNYSNRPANETYVRVVPPVTMAAGEQVLLCMASPAHSVTGIVDPIAGDIWLRSSRYVRVESDDVNLSSHSDTLPAGEDWSWCT